MANHKSLDYTEGHTLASFVFTNQSVREHATGFTSDDLHKVGLQEDNQSFWVLTGINPAVWSPFGDPKSQLQTVKQNVNQTDTVNINHPSDPNGRRTLQISKFIPGMGNLSNTSLDFDLIDESQFVQEDAVNGTDINGQLTLHNVGGTGVVPSAPVTIDNPNAYGTSQSDIFGNFVATCNSYSIVSAHREDDAGGLDSGKAYIYDNTTGNLLHTLDNPNAYSTSANDRFGFAVSITESYSIVGANGEDDAGGPYSGKAYIFLNSTGALLHTLNNPNAYGTSTDDVFGNSVSICESYSIVSAYSENDAGGLDSGKAYIYDNTTGNLLHTLDNPNAYGTSQYDYFGLSVSICESYSIVGAYREDDAEGTDSGKAYIYDNTTGNLLHTLDNPNPYSYSTNDYFGFAVSICESYSIVGAYSEDDAEGTDSGKAYIFDNTTGALLHTLDNPNAYGAGLADRFGKSVSICESYSIVGANEEDDAGGADSGKAYIYDNTTGNLLHTLDNPNPYSTSISDFFGISVSISDSYVIAGASYEDDAGGTQSGKAYLYELGQASLYPATVPFNPVPTVLDNPNAYGTSAGDQFGYSVATCNSYSIVGAYGEDDDGGTGPGTFSGKAYIFDNATGNLLHTLDNPNAYGNSENDYFGDVVSICESYSIVGAYGEDEAGGGGAGKAYIFDNATGNLLHTLDDPNAYGTSGSDYFASSVAITESYSVVGAKYEDEAGNIHSGKAYIFDNATGNLLHTLDNPNAYGASAHDYFGYSVAMCELYTIVGADSEDYAGGYDSGAAYIFDNATGNLLHTLDNPNAYGTRASDSFGRAVAICESYSIVGVRAEDDAGGVGAGKAYIFDNATGNLLHTLDDPNAYGTSEGDNFGQSVDIIESYSIVGARSEDDAGGTNSGKAYIFDNVTGNLLYTIDNPNTYGTSDNDYFGYSVSMSDSYTAVGAPYEDDAGGADSGKAYIYRMPSSPTYYVTTSDANHLDLSDVDIINSVNFTSTVPTNTTLGVLISFDGRLTWKTANMVNHAGITDKTGWSTVTEIEAALSSYNVTNESTLDFAFLLQTTDETVTPSIDLITVNYDENGVYNIAPDSDFTVVHLDPTTTQITKESINPENIKVNVII